MNLSPFIEIKRANAADASAWINATDAAQNADPVNQHTEAAYQAYSKHYAIFALLAYWLIWRGKIRKHIAFFRDILDRSPTIVDLATGEGSLTELALFRGKKQAKQVVALDLSIFMLTAAAKRFRKKPVTLVRGDMMNLPFADGSAEAVTCFGGLNSFPSMEKALSEIRRILRNDGLCRGSVLLYPNANWRRKLVDEWIQKGYQTVSPSAATFETAVQGAGLRFTQQKRVGDVYLFEIRRDS